MSRTISQRKQRGGRTGVGRWMHLGEIYRPTEYHLDFHTGAAMSHYSRGENSGWQSWRTVLWNQKNVGSRSENRTLGEEPSTSFVHSSNFYATLTTWRTRTGNLIDAPGRGISMRGVVCGDHKFSAGKLADVDPGTWERGTKTSCDLAANTARRKFMRRAIGSPRRDLSIHAKEHRLP